MKLSFTENNGTVLPGFLPSVGFFGSSKPSLGFVFGSQSDIRYEAAKNGWLTNYGEFNQNFTKVNNQVFKGSANVELTPDFKIDFLADRAYSENFSEQYDVTDGQYNPRAPWCYQRTITRFRYDVYRLFILFRRNVQEINSLSKR